MASEPQGIQHLSPDKVLSGFSRTRVLRCILAAIAVHVLVAAATSVGYIRDRWLDPEGAARRKAAIESPAPRPPAPAPEAPPPQPKPAAASQDARKATPVYKEITELPKPGEIPKAPDDLGISIDETNK